MKITNDSITANPNKYTIKSITVRDYIKSYTNKLFCIGFVLVCIIMNSMLHNYLINFNNNTSNPICDTTYKRLLNKVTFNGPVEIYFLYIFIFLFVIQKYIPKYNIVELFTFGLFMLINKFDDHDIVYQLFVKRSYLQLDDCKDINYEFIRFCLTLYYLVNFSVILTSVLPFLIAICCIINKRINKCLDTKIDYEYQEVNNV